MMKKVIRFFLFTSSEFYIKETKRFFSKNTLWKIPCFVHLFPLRWLCTSQKFMFSYFSGIKEIETLGRITVLMKLMYKEQDSA